MTASYIAGVRHLSFTSAPFSILVVQLGSHAMRLVIVAENVVTASADRYSFAMYCSHQ